MTGQPDKNPRPDAAVPGDKRHQSPPRDTRLTPRRLSRMCQKELREILRDRRTIITLVLMPLLAYPLLSIAFQKILFTSAPTAAQIEIVVGVPSQQEAAILDRFLSFGQSLVEQAAASEDEEPEAVPQLRMVEAASLPGALKAGDIDVGVRVRQTGQRALVPALGPPASFELLLRQNSGLGEMGVRLIEQRLQAVNERYARDRLQPPVLPSSSVRRRVSGGELTFSLTTFIPLILILMTITGAVYPAIDLTAGERERHTLETLMAAPVPRFGLLVAKYLAVVTVAMLTATANLVAMTVTLMASGLGKLVFGEAGPSITLIDQVFALLILFAAFFSAILLVLTSFARSFKEAQAYLIPLMLLTLAPGMASLLPDLQFSGALAVVPLVNIVLLARDLLEGNVDPATATAAVLSTIFYATAALALAARIFGNDAILYGSQATWSDFFRRPKREVDNPRVSDAMLSLAVIYPAYFLLGNALQQFSALALSVRLLLSAGVTATLFAGIPYLAARLQRAKFSSTFSLRSAGWASLLGGVLLGCSLWPLAHEIFLANRYLGLSSLGEQQLEAARALLDQLKNISPFLILFTMALTPAVCEELCFRGYVMGALRQNLKPWGAILASAALFGIFHVITTSTLQLERLLPSTFLGIVLGWVCVRSGSLIPGILLHATHNGLLLMIGHYRDELMAEGWGIEEQAHMPATWIAVSLATIAVAIGLVWWSGKPGDAARAGKH